MSDTVIIRLIRSHDPESFEIDYRIWTRGYHNACDCGFVGMPSGGEFSGSSREGGCPT